MIRFIDNILDHITMYRLVLYYLVALLFVSFVFGFFGIMPNDPTTLAFSTFLITLVCWVTNWIFARVYKAQTNVESVYITALILALIITPVAATNVAGVGFLIFASVWAMASKYIFAIGNKHIFNPVAFAVALTSFVLNQPATWWIGGNLALLPLVLVGGLLMVRKIQRFDLVMSFFVVALITIGLTSPPGMIGMSLSQTVLHSSLFFLAFVMLTEPLTTPPTALLRIVYGAIVGFFFAPNVHIGSLYLTPEIALLVGNVYSYIVSPKGRHMLTLVRVDTVAKGIYDFIFTSNRALSFRPGQYLEWTLGHRYADDRGNRRYFTIASSPDEPEIHLGVKFYEPASTFKRALALMKEGDTISASHLAGGFVMPKNPDKKLVFIAGGIGVTPFRSMIQHLLDTKEDRSIVMMYANKTLADVAYKDVFDRAQKELGIKTVYTLSGEKRSVPGMVNGRIDATLIALEIPDYRDRTFYISGPQTMVDIFQDTLTDMGVSRFKIKSDFFPGFV
ncbi:MAG: hypothetical protein CO029_03200 [Candidatus Magasanikbacteria bacterium CG_4_9_14_0_2_um_filter_41_10]|uniref:FAD-binding FR-type domain-containing protein n=1 Tax=Candidatus Magasanikbacteria bacterium CG_4_10_14_0_2_um_filter_41_31 TaxID=1974639 RepID=A0A2M7V3H1_9BACT|nr:MAG: hypothetical protein AUJ37_04195 [Candidatus Magasanikbacteria bacterium CG1_02_41_34]PIZ93021.1 MAG: hypothetical protein COX83_02945 [Candidatus Magasanikbacteria bacterium CG_4_10_14_0_2_um_filter_41_31]PJC53356.1 MAG: hypothetical protein CO029_03200 [Candidatus Magasanikbacteria bacterium CG_4_9_14_0_2_um_filter_41_10]